MRGAGAARAASGGKCDQARDLHAGLRHSRQMTILCLPKVTHHHADAVAFLPPDRSGFCPRANPCEPGPPHSLRLMGFTSSRVSSRKLSGLRAFGADDGKAHRTPSAWMILPTPSPCPAAHRVLSVGHFW